MVPCVSAIVTTHQRPDRLRQALLSLRDEAYPNLEWIVVDDGGGLELRDIQNILPDARLVRGQSLGVARARNLGLDAARGELVIFLDDDDIAFPNRIVTLETQAELHGADLCYGLTRRVVDGSDRFQSDVPTHSISDGEVGFCDLITCAPHINSVLGRVETLRQVGGFDASAEHFDDWAIWLRLADRGSRIRFVDEVVSEWRIHDQGLTGAVQKTKAMSLRLVALFDRLIPQVSEESGRAVALARDVVEQNPIETYDDYADAMSRIRAELHADGHCLGARLAHCA